MCDDCRIKFTRVRRKKRKAPRGKRYRFHQRGGLSIRDIILAKAKEKWKKKLAKKWI